MRFLVVGSGVLGTWVALHLRERGESVEIWEADGPMLWEGTSGKAAAMVTPLSEMDSTDVRVAHLGLKSLEIWQQAVKKFPAWGKYFHQAGSWVIASQRECAEFNRLSALISKYFPGFSLAAPAIPPPGNGRFAKSVFFPNEAYLNPRALLNEMHATLSAMDVPIRWNTRWEQDSFTADRFVIDCRGVAAKSDWKGLRGVRGEAILLDAPEVKLNAPVRIFHPRYPLYIVPREAGRFVLGATSIESESLKPITALSCLELLSTAYAFDAGFGEASVLETWVGLRPAFFDHLPRIEKADGYLRANGLYRHGWTIAPEMARQIAECLCESADRQKKVEERWLWTQAA